MKSSFVSEAANLRTVDLTSNQLKEREETRKQSVQVPPEKGVEGDTSIWSNRSGWSGQDGPGPFDTVQIRDCTNPG